MSRGIVSVRESTELLRTAAHVREIDPFDVSDEADRAAGLFGDGPDPMAQLAWRHGGEVAMASTHPDHQRKGLATQLFNHVKTHLEPNLHHSPLQTPEGASWARQADVMPYLRNNNGMRDQAGPEDFGQQVEPWGRYMSGDADTDGEHPPLQSGWERGTVGFDNPLYVPHDYGGWKQSLSQQHGGLTGKALTRALMDRGHDGIITHDKYGIGEMVDLRPKGQRGHRTASRWLVADGGPGNSDEDLNGSTSHGDDDRHPDHGWQERTFGCAHTHGGRVLPQYRTAAAFGDPSGWNNSSSTAPSPVATQGASAYHSLTGISEPPPVDFSQHSRTPQSVTTVGRAYDALPTYSPDAVPHYAAMQKEVNDQYHHMTHNLGINVQSVDHDPYPDDVHHMMADVNNNKRLQVLGTHVTGGHPFFGDADNDKFRAVHDFYGHAGTGRGFDRHGEEAAFVKHAGMFTPAARPALASETRGQNSSMILNGGFGPQKVAIMDPRMHTAAEKSYLKDGKCKYCKSPATKSILHSEGMAYVQTCDKHFEKGRKDAEACVPFGEPDPGNIDKVYDLATKKVIGVRRMGRQIISARDQVAMLEPWLAMRKGAPFAGYEDFADCEHQNEDKRDNSAYCGEIKHRTEDKTAVFEDERHVPENEVDDPKPKRPSAQWGADVMRHLEKNPDGITVRDQVGDNPTSGFMVSHPGVEGEESRSRLDPHKIRDYYEHNFDLINQDSGNGYGGWDAPRTPESGHGGQPGWYHDVSQNIHDPGAATDAAVSGNQQAVFDLDNDQEVSTPDMVKRHRSAAVDSSAWYS